jgi:beta-carotene hydroxylase
VAQLISRPQCPAGFVKASKLQTAAHLAYAVTMAFAPVLISLWIQKLAAPILLACIFQLPFLVIGGYGFFMLAGVAHEGFHQNLHASPKISAMIGTLFSSAVPGFFAIGFYVSHWKHHRFTNTPDDPDYMEFGRFNNFWSRALLARLSANNSYRRIALDIAFGRSKEKFQQGTFSAAELRVLAMFNCLTQGMWLSFYGALYFFARDAYFVIVVCLVFTVVITGLNPYQEHGATGNEEFNNARSRTSPIFTFLMYGTNYHLEHHLYPRVPCWRLPRLHRWLKATAWYQAQNAIREGSFILSFITAMRSSVKYGHLAKDDAHAGGDIP